MIQYEEEITPKFILDRINEEDIYERYLGDNFIIGRSIKVPWRKDDTSSFSLFYNENNKLLWKDHAYNKAGNVFQFVQNYFNLNFSQTLKKIKHELLSNNSSNGNSIYNNNPISNINRQLYSPINKSKAQITFQPKPFSKKEIEWWKDQGISTNGLERFKVISAEKVFYNENLWMTSIVSSPIYLYEKDNKFKIYRPLNVKGYRWSGNMSNSTLLGIDLIPDNYNELILLNKSYKDVISVYENNNIQGICKAGESCYYTKEDIDLIKRKSNKLLYIGDFDYTGIMIANKLKRDFGIKSIFLTTNRHERRLDYTDYFKQFGKELTINKLNTLIKCVMY